MKTQSSGSPAVTRRPIDRRSFLGLMGLGAAAIGMPSVLASCSSNGAVGAAGGGGAVSQGVLPNYVPIEYVAPDFPSVNGSTAGYAKIPAELVRAFSSPPGSGGRYTAMTPLWGTIPPTQGNQYYEAVSSALGTTIEFQISDGNTYGDKLAAVLASAKDVPDWVCIPSWNVPPRFGQAVESLFEDLTPYLAGDKIEKYKNLANIPTDAWRFCVFNDKLYGLPFPGEVITDAIFYRADIFAELGITEQPRSAAELLDLAREITDPSAQRWGTDDLWTAATMMFAVPPKWKVDDAGKLVHRVETEEYRAALEWQAQLFASGAVHPDAVADNAADAKQRFESGQTLIANDGVGGWHEALGRQLGSNPDYDQQPFEPIAHDGGTPRLFKGNPANIFSFIKKNEDKAKIEEMLAVADFLASPFGTEEYQLINFGVEGVHYELDADNLPVATELAATELQPTYIFLVDPPVVNSKVQYPGFVEDFCTWMADAAQYLEEPVFYGMQITEPSQFASLATPFPDLEKDIARGRKSMADLDEAVETWRSSGGEELRAFYQDILDQQ
ncbi:extracellular solute-binding protein [Isoptericola variabilis]|uniref:Extracellular solute-binding protein family 1 n=1 Tax=Isoptericola variabilis (strain 225) TaxID=743718 RepID=F6FR63_ISOV2|nr:extracellular solute-binding protein [Isoptericola variabilis]AEG45013.1 extracellular solute-binding protein family 1 [Isoptericola variabilis 225]TWH26139.1 putative aldouronate transport system substrate-binding protein [Isoptericola variabilis J7]